MTCVYDLFDCYTLSGVTISENMARKHMYLKWMLSWLQYEMEQKGVFVDYLLYDRRCTNWHFISTYRGPSRGVPLDGGWGKEGKSSNDCTCCVPTVISLVIQYTSPKVEILLLFLVQFFPLACLPCLSRILLLGHLLIT